MRRLRVDEVILLLSVVVYGVSSGSLVSGVGDGFHALKTQRGSVDDPVTSLQIIYPVDGAVETAPVKLAMAINIRAGGAELYKELYSERSVCFESRNVTLACFPVNESWMGIKDCKAATYTVRAYFSETDENHKPIDLAARATDFVRARQAKYRAGFVAFGDLSPLALREVHSNLQEGRSFCHGFERNLWLKTSGDAVRNGLYRMLPWFPEPLEFGFVVAKMNKTDLHEIATIISTPASAGVKVSHFPAHETFHAYTRRICAEARLSFPTAVKSTSCSAMADRLKTEFQVFSEQTSEVNYQLN
ncbi:hypothetical protein KRP22_012775 [Phytophthora ramorum]|nr:hypothetical protein KRP22_8797 [Phytophthora ramorum]